MNKYIAKELTPAAVLLCIMGGAFLLGGCIGTLMHPNILTVLVLLVLVSVVGALLLWWMNDLLKRPDRSITFQPGKLTIQLEQDDGQIAPCEVDAMFAEETGLAYFPYPSEREPAVFIVVHVPSLTQVSRWHTTDEAEARAWIALLDEIQDWTASIPFIRPFKMEQVIDYAIVGALHEVPGQEPVEA